ncbi:MAG: dTMP kinase [Culicoidibacterales bacterium]
METKKILAELTTETTIFYPNFISFEGGEGSGKTTVLKQISQKLSDAGYEVIITREPGGFQSDIAEHIRELILSDKMGKMTPLTEAFLYAAARTQHVQQTLIPELTKGKIILSDRYVDSSLVYQGLGWDNLATVVQINKAAICNVMPKTTLFFDVKPEIAIGRVMENRTEEINHLDAREMSFHQLVYAGFKQLEAIYDNRYVNIDASLPLAEVEQAVYQIILAQVEDN